MDRRVAKETLVLLACLVDAVCEALEDFQVPLARQDDPASEVPPALTANLATKDPRAFRVSQALWECQEHKDRSAKQERKAPLEKPVPPALEVTLARTDQLDPSVSPDPPVLPASAVPLVPLAPADSKASLAPLEVTARPVRTERRVCKGLVVFLAALACAVLEASQESEELKVHPERTEPEASLVFLAPTDQQVLQVHLAKRVMPVHLVLLVFLAVAVQLVCPERKERGEALEEPVLKVPQVAKVTKVLRVSWVPQVHLESQQKRETQVHQVLLARPVQMA